MVASFNIQHKGAENLSGKSVFVAPPEYFPGLAYMSMVRAADVFVLADTFQYSRQSFQNRCKVRSADGWHWLTIPVVGGQHGKPIHSTNVDNQVAWTSKHTRAIRYNYRSSPYYDYYATSINAIWADRPDTLESITVPGITLLLDFLDIETPVIQTSRQWPDISRLSDLKLHLAGSTVIGPPQLIPYYTHLFGNAKAHSFTDTPYWQNFAGFEPGLSAIDALLNLGPGARDLI